MVKEDSPTRLKQRSSSSPLATGSGPQSQGAPQARLAASIKHQFAATSSISMTPPQQATATRHKGHANYSQLLQMVSSSTTTTTSKPAINKQPTNHSSWRLSRVSVLVLCAAVAACLGPQSASCSDPTKKATGKAINEWLVHKVAPAVAGKLVDEVLQSAGSKTWQARKSKQSSSSSSSSETGIDTQALANKIVDKLADQLKKSGGAIDKRPAEKKTRKGKSLVGDSVHQVVQNLFSGGASSNRDNRRLFGRAIEKKQQRSRGASGPASPWLMVKEPQYDQQLFTSTDSSQLDENPVVLRAEHGSNLTTLATPVSHDYQNMLTAGASQMSNKLLQKHRAQQKYVHVNRHQQQHLAPKPWLNQQQQQQPRRNNHQQNSPYSLPAQATSDINIVQAPSSPSPPIILPSVSTSVSTSTSTQLPSLPFSFVPHQILGAPSDNLAGAVVTSPATVTHVGNNKFKVNNRLQHPINAVSLSSNSWYSNNRAASPYNQRHNHNHATPTTSTTTTTTTSTTTTTTTTTPEPPPPEPETMESLMELEPQTSPSVVSSILSSAAESVLNSINNQAATSEQQLSTDDMPSYSNSNNSTYSSITGGGGGASSTTSSSAGLKGALPSTTSARHSVISAEAIPTALGAPLYHLTRANFTTTSIIGPTGPSRKSSNSPLARAAVQYFQKGLNSISSNIFKRENKSWARRLGLSSLLLGLLYGGAMMAGPGVGGSSTSALELLQLLSKTNKRRKSRDSIMNPLKDISATTAQASLPVNGNIGQSLVDNSVSSILYQQPHLIPILEQIIQQEQQHQAGIQQPANFLMNSLQSRSGQLDYPPASSIHYYQVPGNNPSQYYVR